MEGNQMPQGASGAVGKRIIPDSIIIRRGLAEGAGGGGATAQLGRDPAKPGRFPARKGTALAHVLADLLEGRHLTSGEAWIEAATSRLSAQAHALWRDWGWTILSETRAVPCSDGRVSSVSAYFLHDEAISACKAEAVQWILEVRAARLALRTLGGGKHGG